MYSPRNCEECGAEFMARYKDKGFHCSTSCYNKFRHRRSPRQRSERVRIRDTKWMQNDRRKNTERYLAMERNRRARDIEHLGEEGAKRRTKDYNLRHAYGITLEDYERMANEQDGVCAICGESQVPKKNNGNGYLHVDHDHLSGKIRGLLCHLCNQGMVAVDGHQGWPEKAAIYAAKYRST